MITGEIFRNRKEKKICLINKEMQISIPLLHIFLTSRILEENSSCVSAQYKTKNISWITEYFLLVNENHLDSTKRNSSKYRMNEKAVSVIDALRQIIYDTDNSIRFCMFLNYWQNFLHHFYITFFHWKNVNKAIFFFFFLLSSI